ncbi:MULTISPECIES: glycosyltransferase family 87 protein [unclassified Streptomyces]|uniref:glycosyltransferase family 87 protein n=1 Tax=unclassified Streptomyces TaxID=2593676 RepID=UPI0027E3EA53|nr:MULTISPECIES: glycosyltransferase family 87 protein [unclassified Streptomyces]
MRGPHTGRGRLLFVLALAAAVTAFTATVPLLRDWFDLRVYYGTVHSWVHHDGGVYDYRVPGTAYGFTYPPFAAVAMLPMALLPWPAAVAGALLLDLAALAVAARVLAGRAWHRHGWYRCALAACALALFEPVRDTVSFGQVNLLLLALVLADGGLSAAGRTRWAGAGIGIAAAIKLTPALFIVLLLIARRPRAAAVATSVATAATGLAALVAPGSSRFYWTEAMWDTGRVGRLDYISNQSLQGVLARLGEPHPALWAVAALAVLGVWARRAHRAAAAGDLRAALALTGLAACLVSPVTWVHHLVWTLPAFAVLVRAGRLRTAAALYALLCSSVVWLWFDDASGIGGFLGGSAYTWITLGLLLWLPAGHTPEGGRTARRSANATPAAPAPAAPAIAVTEAQPAPPSPAVAVTAAAGTGTAEAGATAGPACEPALAPSSEPTGSTSPSAAKPQSSRARASS